MKLFENSWHIAIPDLKKQDSVHHHYFCKCGHTQEISLQSQNLDFLYIKCQICSNSYYLDFETFQNKQIVRCWKNFNWSYELFEDRVGWHILFYYSTPTFKNSFTEFGSTKQFLQKVSLLKNGIVQLQEKKSYLLDCHVYDNNNAEISKTIEKQFSSPLYAFVLAHLNDTLKWIDMDIFSNYSDEVKLHVLGFFLQNPQIKDEALIFQNLKSTEKEQI